MPKVSLSFPMTNYMRGILAEIYVIGYLTIKGYRIIAWRYKTPVGEIDIIAGKRNLLVFVEVKLRRNINSAFESITPRMQDRISRAAKYFIAKNRRFSNHSIRFDAIAVSRFSLRHLDNAWMTLA